MRLQEAWEAPRPWLISGFLVPLRASAAQNPPRPPPLSGNSEGGRGWTVGVGWPEDASPYLLCVDLPAFKSGYYDFPNGLSVMKSQRNPDSR